MSKYNGNDLIALGFEPGPAFAEMLKVANSLGNHDVSEQIILDELTDIYLEYHAEPDIISMKKSGDFRIFLDEGRNEFEIENNKIVMEKMRELVRIPTIVDAAIMPDASPSGGGVGEIPVGGVAVAKNAIHPGMHSADICCSMFLTELDVEGTSENASKLLDTIMKVTHFGVGGRKEFSLGHNSFIGIRAQENGYLASVKMLKAMSDHLGTQGDGNHFFFVGRNAETGNLTMVTHHGSRNPGALLYKEGMRVAKQMTAEICPDAPAHNAWIPFDSMEGQLYWDALQIIREWTKYNHTTIHDEVMRAYGVHEFVDRFWNEHNFVFKRGELFYHAKGSTPVFEGYAHDADWQNRTIIPLNMGEPILIVKGHPNNKFGFAPHGAGRNMSRTKFKKLNEKKTPEQIMKEQVGHIDARFFTGRPDISELPGAYKDAQEVQRQIEHFELAKIVNKILPLGSIMAGEVEKPWLKRK